MTAPRSRPPRDLLVQLEPAAERFLNRHLSMAKEWFPHDYVPYSAGPRLRQGAVDAGPAAHQRRGADRLRGQPPDRGQPAELPPRDPSHVRARRRGLDQLGEPLDRRGGPPRHRASRLPRRHPQHRPGGARALADEPAPGGLQPRRRRQRPARTGVRGLPGARDPDQPPQHRPLLGGPGGRPDHGPHRGGREPAHGLLPRHAVRGDQARSHRPRCTPSPTR